MKKTYFWLLSSLFVGAFTFVSCSSDDDEDGGNTSVETPDPVNYEKTGGEGTITLGDGTTVNVTVPKLSNENVNGVFIVDNELSLELYYDTEENGKYGYKSCNLSISDYSTKKTVYNDVEFNFSESGYDDEGTYYSHTISSVNNDSRAAAATNKVTVTQEQDGSIHFLIEGDVAVSTGQQLAEGEPNGTISMEFVMPLAASGACTTNVSSKQSSYPSFTPWLGKKVDGVLQITKSQLVGSAVLLWYYDMSLGYSDYENLKAQAIKALGNPVVCYDKSEGQDPGMDWEDMCYSYFYKDNKFIMVSYCPWRQEEDPSYYNLPCNAYALKENHVARIQVHAIEGMNFDYNALIQTHR